MRRVRWTNDSKWESEIKCRHTMDWDGIAWDTLHFCRAQLMQKQRVRASSKSPVFPPPQIYGFDPTKKPKTSKNALALLLLVGSHHKRLFSLADAGTPNFLAACQIGDNNSGEQTRQHHTCHIAPATLHQYLHYCAVWSATALSKKEERDDGCTHSRFFEPANQKRALWGKIRSAVRWFLVAQRLICVCRRNQKS